ncbi:LysR substrate-binding domain-containing protein [Streptomyces sp. NPDC026092]|uniref:LysR family transcriptional regulator n=1 Tax=Streptomyces sp. NPDC026092 TaxID=3154797 RepID=UPI0033E0DA52
MLDVRRMQVLRAVVTSGSVTAAAANLGYTPSAVSQQIGVLEKEAGIALLERFGRGVRPTAAGLLLTEHADVIGRQVAEAETALADLRAGRTGQVAVRYFATAGADLVAPALARFRREHPGVRVDLRIAEGAGPDPEADVTLVVRPRDAHRDGAGTEGGLRLVHLADDPYRAVLPKGHRFADRRVVDLAELADEPWVGSERAGPCLDAVLEACAAAGFTPDIAVECEEYATAQGFVAAGLGISLVPLMGLGSRHPNVVVRRLRGPEPVRSIHAAVRESSLALPAVRGLLTALQEAWSPTATRRPAPARATSPTA